MSTIYWVRAESGGEDYSYQDVEHFFFEAAALMGVFGGGIFSCNFS